jgi:hypothetical protein
LAEGVIDLVKLGFNGVAFGLVIGGRLLEFFQFGFSSGKVGLGFFQAL